MGRLLAVDPGEKRIGLAVSDELGFLASPLRILKRDSTREAVERIVSLVQQEHIAAVIVGVPISLSGEVGAQARRSLRFAEALRQALSVPVHTWNEQYSTVEAQRMLSLAGRRVREQRGMIDAAAAAVLLQDYLDATR